MMRLSQRQAFSLLAKIHAAPQPAAAKELLAPAIRLLIQGKLYKEAQHLAGTAINTFPKDSLYHQLLGEAYQAAIAAGYSSSRTEKKMQREFELAHQLHNNMP